MSGGDGGAGGGGVPRKRRSDLLDITVIFRDPHQTPWAGSTNFPPTSLRHVINTHEVT